MKNSSLKPTENKKEFVYNQLVPELCVTNFKKSLDFYTKILGFSVVYQRKESGFAFLCLGDAQIMIDEISEPENWKTGKYEYPLGRGINFEIGIENIDLVLEKIRKAKIKLFVEPEEVWYRKDRVEVGNKQFLIQDPDGYLLRFAKGLGERPFKK